MPYTVCRSRKCHVLTNHANGFCVKHNRGQCRSKDCTVKTKCPNGFCKKHGGMTSIPKSTIATPTTITNSKCRNVACSNHIKPNSVYCALHSQKSRCPNCIDWIDSRIGNKKYDGYCATCFPWCFPNDPRINTTRTDTKEFKVQDFINRHFEGFIHNVPLYSHNCDCTCRRRIDHYLLLGGSILAVETDEYQHRYYSEADEGYRYNDLYMHFSGKWIFIRFNVNSYTDNTGHYRLTKLSARLEVLRQEIEKQIKRINNDQNTELLEIVPLFYDGYDYQPPVREVTNEIIPPPSNT